jgi:hypothetical protein
MINPAHNPLLANAGNHQLTVHITHPNSRIAAAANASNAVGLRNPRFGDDDCCSFVPIMDKSL